MKIKNITRTKYCGPVYNLGVSPNHNYFANGMLVHNCYQGSTATAPHADFGNITNIIYALSEAEVFEIAIGGGEPTLHPRFKEILEYTRESHIIPNFTTKDLKWLKDNIKDISNIIGSCAVSVTNARDLRQIQTIMDYHELPQGKICAQVVMGTQSKESFKDIVRAACNCRVPLTLLGYKTNGRGAKYSPADYSDWMSWVKEALGDEKWYKIGIDTALVQQSAEQLKDTPSWLYHKDEGKFSWYIDVVTNKNGPSSYDAITEYKSAFSCLEAYEDF